MALPAVEKTWQFSINLAKPSSGTNTTDYKHVLLTIKKALTTFPLNPWTVVGSSDSLAASIDGTDRWGIYLQGTDTNANVNTSGGNNVLRIRSGPTTQYSVFSVTSGASVAKTQIVTDLNNGGTGFPSNPLTASLVASITGTNQLTITDTSTGNSCNAYIEIDVLANGSTLNTPCGYIAGTPTYQTPTHCTVNKLVCNTVGNAHSWIVLRQAALNGGIFDLCLDCTSNTAPWFITAIVGLAGIAGGTTTNRPTWTNSFTMISNTYWFIQSNLVSDFVIHAMESSDGQCTRVVGIMGSNASYTVGSPILWWIFDTPKNPVSGWTNPCVWQVSGAGTSNIMYMTNYKNNAYFKFYANSVQAVAYLTCEGSGTTGILEQYQLQKPNDISGEQLILPIGIVSDTASAKGRHGQLYDLWWGNNNATARGGMADVTYPNTTTRTHWQCGDFIFPWPGINSPPGPAPIAAY